MPEQTIEAIPEQRSDRYPGDRRYQPKIRQTELEVYWQLRRIVDKFENRVRDGAQAESGALTIPALRPR